MFLTFPQGPRTQSQPSAQHPEQGGAWSPSVFPDPGPNPQEAAWAPGHTDPGLGPLQLRVWVTLQMGAAYLPLGRPTGEGGGTP